MQLLCVLLYIIVLDENGKANHFEWLLFENSTVVWHTVRCVSGVVWEGISQNGLTGEAKAGGVKESGFTRLIVHFYLGLQNIFMLQYLDLRKTGEAEAGKSLSKRAPKMVPLLDVY